jgi:flagellar hook-length control protein FliK
MAGNAVPAEEPGRVDAPASVSRRSGGDEDDDSAPGVTVDPPQDTAAQVGILTSMWWSLPGLPAQDVAPPAADAAATLSPDGTPGAAAATRHADARRISTAAGNATSGPAVNDNAGASTTPGASGSIGLQEFIAGDEVDPAPSTTSVSPDSPSASSLDQGPSKSSIGAPLESGRDGAAVADARSSVRPAQAVQNDPGVPAPEVRADSGASNQPSAAVRDIVASAIDAKTKGRPAAAASSDGNPGIHRLADPKNGDRAAAAGNTRRTESVAAESVLQSALAAAGQTQSAPSQNPDHDGAAGTSEREAPAKDMEAAPGRVAASILTGAAHTDYETVQTVAQSAVTGQTAATEKTSAPSAAMPPAGADRPAVLDDHGLHRQMVQAIQLQSRNGVGDARITLQPEYLGEVSIALRVEDGGVTAHVSAASAQVREWLGANESMLRQGLLDQGLKLERLIVSEEPSSTPARDSRDRDARREQQPQPDEEPRPRPRRDASTTFEVTV